MSCLPVNGINCIAQSVQGVSYRVNDAEEGFNNPTVTQLCVQYSGASGTTAKDSEKVQIVPTPTTDYAYYFPTSSAWQVGNEELQYCYISVTCSNGNTYSCAQ